MALSAQSEPLFPAFVSAHYAYLHQGISVQEHPAGDTGVSAGPAHLPGGRSAAEALQYAVRDVIGPKRIS